MKFISRYLVLLGACSVVALGLAGCTRKQPDQAANTRPSCVTLPMYSSVIEQVMNVQPTWELLAQTYESYHYQWALQDDSGKHTLSTTLTSDECVCATNASSHFNMGRGKEEMAGLFQGAAVAPVSNLDYTAAWLEPRILFSCGAAYLFQRPYEAETIMEDGTTWTLTCSRITGSEAYDSLYTLAIVAPGCVDLLE